MKTAGRKNPNHGVAWPRNRAHGAEGQNQSRSIKWAEKQEKFRPKEMFFFLTSTFIELIGHWLAKSKPVYVAYANECFDSTLKATSPLLPLLFLEGVPILLCFF